MKNVATFIRVPLKSEVEPSQEDRQDFLVALLSGVPFYKEYRIENLIVRFSSPTIDIFKDNLDIEELFFDCLEEVKLEGISVKGGFHYKKGSTPSVQERKQIFTLSNNQKSPLGYVLVQMFYHFIFLFQKLLEEVLDKGFFVTDSTKRS